jgi:hypothetical protein
MRKLLLKKQKTLLKTLLPNNWRSNFSENRPFAKGAGFFMVAVRLRGRVNRRALPL